MLFISWDIIMRFSFASRTARPKFHLLASATLAFSVLSPAARAADAAPEEITVQALRGTKLSDLDVSTQVVTAEQIEQTPASSVSEILQKIPGVLMPQLPAGELHPTGDPVEIRGFGSTPGRTLVMVDGIPFSDPFFRYTDWQKIPNDAIDRIEVIRGGGATTLWGNMAMAGVINIVTREPQPGELRASLGYGSFNTVKGNLAATLYSDDKIRIGADLSGSRTDGFNKVPDSQNSPIFGDTASNTKDGTISAYYDPSEDAHFYVKLGAHWMHEQGLQEAIANNDWGTYDARMGGSLDLEKIGRLELNTFFEQWHYATQNASDQCYNQFPVLVAASSKCPGNIASPATASSYLGQIENAPYSTAGGSLVWKPHLDAGLGLRDVLVGVDGRITGATDELAIYSRANPVSPIIGKPPIDVHGQHQFEGVFAQATWEVPGLPLAATLGLREDLWQVTGGSVNGSPLSDNSAAHFDPRFGLKYQVTPTISLRGAVYEDFDAPGMNQSFRSFLSGSSLTLGNPSVQPETNLGGEIGAAYDDRRLKVEVNAFYNTLDNFIQSGKVCNSTAACASVIIPSAFGLGSAYSSITKNFNAGKARIAGGEIISSYQVSDTLSVSASWTRTAAEITDNGTLAQAIGTALANTTLPVNQQLGGVPAWIATASATWEIIPDLSVTGLLRSNPHFWTGTNHLTSGLNSSVTTVDLGLRYRVSRQVQLFFDAQNIFNVNYLTSAANDGAGYSSPSNIGTPFNAFGGARVSF
jgi:outer membrane receptor protein involved in Fe transport